ncbi:MarR family winged helix-turn-helix transcriptional regulator [Mycolicibacterium sp. 050158]|jgi:DNA-binding MarR family transcriptional regulator|uniref:MarR family winged helix-turn-helix transcriptional regulator n=1 Tax=Mycolicibacterium sp. 050158 TaxID=3090602 RepID=UPI00299D84D5|nr:MarR family winged helix-turn-helix transcriptional regulator [Mycolicibacterium sp. 050158]MDX1889416.1 MarR family winged helix-turn-helix transcriptional regulator [Mycolicibacterium sp. 050158]
MWLSEDQQRVWRNYLAMTTELQAEINRQLQRDCGLSLSDYDVLVAISELTACRVKELGDRLGWEQSRLSHQLRRMQARGLVDKRGAEHDRRGATVELTDAGRSALASAAPGHAELVRALVFDGVGAGELRALDRWTSQVLSRLGREPA